MFRFVLFSLFIGASALASCPEGFYKISAHRRSAYYRGDGSFVPATFVKSSCRQYSATSEVLLKSFKEGLPLGWPHKKETSVKWTEDYKQRVIEAIEEMPEILWSHSIKGLYRALKSKDFLNPASNGDGFIVLYNSAFEAKHRLSRVLAHELAHEMYRELSEKEQLDYCLKAGWSYEIGRNRIIYWKPRKEEDVETDSKTSRDEDFTNNIEYFLFDPTILREKNPKAYDWIKNKYGDKLKLRKAKP